MTFAGSVKGREIECVRRLVGVFGLVEERQMRRLFSRLSDMEFGKILSRLAGDGLIFRTPDGADLAADPRTPPKREGDGRVRCFWAFLAMRGSVRDFCAGDAPALVSVLTRRGDCDLIPVSAAREAEIDLALNALPEETARLLVAGSASEIERLSLRRRNDYLVLVGRDGDTEAYAL